MSIPVDLTALRAQIARFGANAFLVTTNAEGGPHISSVTVVTTDDLLTMGCGRQTRANVEARPAVSLLWPDGSDDRFCLIVDATVTMPPTDTLTVRPASAVLHRVASAPAGTPRCLPVGPDER